MTTQIKSETPAEKSKTKVARTRSPAYPSFDLQTSIEKARIVFNNEKRGTAPIESIAAAWELNHKSSSALLAVSTLKKFGLLEEVEDGKGRKFKLTQSALRILLDEQSDSTERTALIKQAALAPKIHAELWQRYGGELPSDLSLSTYLKIEKAFNGSYVDGFIKEFRSTIAFAKLAPTDKITIEGKNENETEQVQREPMKPATASESRESQVQKPSTNPPPPAMATLPQPSGVMSVLREFTIPLTSGMGVLKVPYPMSEDDFELFTGTLQLWKKQLVKTSDSVAAIFKRISAQLFPRKALWKNAHNDKPIIIVGEMGERDGVKYYKSEDGTGIPATELTFQP